MKQHTENFYFKRLKEITIQESDEINELILSSFQNSRINHYDNLVYYKYENRIIGFAGLYFIDKYLSINQLCVHKDFRNQGIATQILEFIEKIYKYISIILYIDKNKNNTDYLYKFYTQRGFKEIDYLKTFNLTYNKDDEYLLIKDG